MKCEGCTYQTIQTIIDDIAFDTEFRQTREKKIEFCEINRMPCEDVNNCQEAVNEYME